MMYYVHDPRGRKYIITYLYSTVVIFCTYLYTVCLKWVWKRTNNTTRYISINTRCEITSVSSFSMSGQTRPVSNRNHCVLYTLILGEIYAITLRSRRFTRVRCYVTKVNIYTDLINILCELLQYLFMNRFLLRITNVPSEITNPYDLQ